MLNIAHYQRNANQSYSETPPHTGQNGHHPKSTNNKCWRGCEKTEPSYTVGDNVNRYSHYGEQYGESLKNLNKTII